MSLRVALCLLAFAACRPDPKTELRDRYCAQLETSRLRVDAEVKSAGLALHNVSQQSGFIVAREVTLEAVLWTYGASCAQVAEHWHEAVGYSTALQADWYEVRLGVGELVIDPPSPLRSSPEIQDACPLDAKDAAEKVKAAAKAMETAFARWSADRDRALSRCEAAGWHRRDAANP